MVIVMLQIIKYVIYSYDFEIMYIHRDDDSQILVYYSKQYTYETTRIIITSINISKSLLYSKQYDYVYLDTNYQL